MSTFTLAISCWTTSNLPWFMDLTFQVPMQYCSLQHRTLLLSPVTFTAGYCFCFDSIPSIFLELFLHWFPVAYWAPTDLGFSFSILSFCLFILFMGLSRQEYWSGLSFPFPMYHILSDLCTMTRLSWVAPWAWLSFLELDKAVVLVWVDQLVFCEYGFSLPALWCTLATPTILLVFLLPWVWDNSSQLLQQSTAAAPYLGWGVYPHWRSFWPSRWDRSSRPSCACTATAPWTWGCSSQPPPLASGMGLLLQAATPGLRCGLAPPIHHPWPQAWGRGVGPLATAPDLRRGVAPPSHRPWPPTWVALLGRSCAVTAWYSRLLPLTSDVGKLLLAAALRAWGPPGFCPWLRMWGSSSRRSLSAPVTAARA